MRCGVGKLSEAQWWTLRRVGFGLFVVSFLMPAGFNNLQFFAGSIIFVQTPVYAYDFLSDGNVWAAILTFAAWLANLSVAVPRQKWVPLPAILAVWVAYGYFFENLAGFIPFYPWAIGITVVQVANLLRRESDASGL